MIRTKLIKGKMAEQELTVKDVAALAGLSTFTISAIRNGNENVTLANFAKLAKAINTPVHELLQPEQPAHTSPVAPMTNAN